MAATRSLRGFAIIVIVMEIFFAIIYAFQEGYSQTVSFADFNGLITAIFLCMLLLVGFGLLTVYLKQYHVAGLVLNFIMLAFTIQWYFLVKKFWYCIKLTDTVNIYGLGDNLYNIRLSSILKYNYPTDTSTPIDIKDMKYFTLSQAICCAISMFVILFPLMGKVGPAQAVVITFVGNVGYTLNESVFWRLNISDNGYGMKIFLFGALTGIVVSLIRGRELTQQNQQYTSTYENQSLAFLGSIFVWVLMPWISVVDQAQADSSTFVADFRQIAPLNIIFALSSSAAASFSTSIWLRGKISVHDVIFSCFSGAIAYGSSSNVFPNPWPAMLIGTLSGMISTYLNTKMKSINHKGVVDSLGSICLFLVPSLGGAIYSAILYATTAYGPYNDMTYRQVDGQRSRWTHGAYQLVGLGITIGISLVTGLLIGLFIKIFNNLQSYEQMFTDKTYIEKDDSKQLLQTKRIKVN